MSEKENNNQDTPKTESNAENKAAPKNEPRNNRRGSNKSTPKRDAGSSADKPAAEAAVKDTKASEKPAAEKPAAPKAAAASAPAAKQPATWPGKLALALSIAALGASGYLYTMAMQAKVDATQLSAQIDNRLDDSFAEVRSTIDQTTAKLNTELGRMQGDMQSRFTSEKSNIDKLQDRLTKGIQQVLAKQTNSRKDWLLAEAEYLLRLANQRVLMEKTADGALALMLSADKILKETDDVSIYEVREALAADIATLDSVPKLDMEGTFLKLGAMNSQVGHLRLIPLTKQQPIPELLEQITPESVQESWGEGLAKSWARAMDKLNELVVVQHRDEKVEPLLSPDQTYYLQQNLHLMLEQAQLALLQRKQDAYNAALSKAEEWLSTYFEQNDGTTIALLKGVRELKAVEVAPELPSIANSLSVLKSYIAEMTRLKQEGA